MNLLALIIDISLLLVSAFAVSTLIFRCIDIKQREQPMTETLHGPGTTGGRGGGNAHQRRIARREAQRRAKQLASA